MNHCVFKISEELGRFESQLFSQFKTNPMSYIKNIGLSAMMFGAIVFTSCSNSQTPEATKTESAKQTTQQVNKVDFENALIVDVRTPQEFAAGHFEGAINIPLNTVEANLDQFKGQEQIVVYCRSGARSGNAKKILDNAGFENVINATNVTNLNKLKENQ